MNALQIAEIAETWVAQKMDAYIQKVATVYKIPVPDLKKMADETSSACESSEFVERKKLKKMKKKELAEKCKTLGHPVTGNKDKLIDRIMSGKAKPKEKKKTTSKTTKAKNTVNVCKNERGNYAYDGLVIDKGTRMVVGEEMENGDIAPLTASSIDKCHRYKLKFAMPLNLNTLAVSHSSDEEEIIEEDEIDDDEIIDDDDDEDDEDEDDEDEDDDHTKSKDDETKDDEEFIYEEEAVKVIA